VIEIRLKSPIPPEIKTLAEAVLARVSPCRWRACDQDLKAVVLAAGRGERLKPLTNQVPKPLVHLNNRTLIGHVIHEMEKAGIEDFVVVTGYQGKLLRSRLEGSIPEGIRIEFIHNHDYPLGNASSLLCAERALINEDSFILSMSDHITTSKLIEMALDSYEGESILCVDRQPICLSSVEEATKVALDEEGYVINIGKRLEEWDAVDTGVFNLNTQLYQLVGNDIEPVNISDCMMLLIKALKLKACDVTGIPWIDVDTMIDLVHAREVVEEWI